MNCFFFWIVDILLIHFFISKHDAFQSTVLHYLAHSCIMIINIMPAFKYTKMSNKSNKFFDFFMVDNVVCVLANNIIFNISNYLKILSWKFLDNQNLLNTDLSLLIKIYILCLILSFF